MALKVNRMARYGRLNFKECVNLQDRKIINEFNSPVVHTNSINEMCPC
jgi:hypothetical protein